MNITQVKPQENGKNFDKKETITRWNLIAFDDGQFKELATIRWYMGRSSKSSVIYCTIWITSHTFAKHFPDWTMASGTGQAGGGGNCKSSAAFAEACHMAGIKFDKEIAGRGDSVVSEALEALGRYAGLENVQLVRG